ncbi:MAG: hypothetical protein WA102_07740 [Candidatus Methanoperedens sp.]
MKKGIYKVLGRLPTMEYYNFVRPHQSLKGKTPAEAAGSTSHIENGLRDLIDLAINYKIHKLNSFQ